MANGIDEAKQQAEETLGQATEGVQQAAEPLTNLGEEAQQKASDLTGGLFGGDGEQ